MSKRDIKAKRWERRKLKRFLNAKLPFEGVLYVNGRRFGKATLLRSLRPERKANPGAEESVRFGQGGDLR